MPTNSESDRLPGITAGSAAAPSGEEGAVVRLDLSMFESLAGLPGRTHPGLIDQLHEGFPDLASAAQDRIAAAAARGDWADACRAAHNLKSNSGFLGLVHYANCCRALETLARSAADGVPPVDDAWKNALAALTHELPRSLAAFGAHLDQGRQPESRPDTAPA